MGLKKKKRKSKEGIVQQLPDVLEHQVVLVVLVDQGHPVRMDQRQQNNINSSHQQKIKPATLLTLNFIFYWDIEFMKGETLIKSYNIYISNIMLRSYLPEPNKV